MSVPEPPPRGAVAYVALGSNLGDRAGAIQEAIRRLGAAGAVEAVSSLYETEAWGYAGAPPFLNAALRLRTPLGPAALLRAMQAIEADLGRERSVPNAPRTLDLDLLLHDDAIVAAPGLNVPHPRLHERAFVLVPLAEIAPEARHPALGKTAAEMLAGLGPVAGVRRFAAPPQTG